MSDEIILYRGLKTRSASRWRLWFTAHIFAYVLFCLLQTAFLPVDPVALALRTLLCAAIMLHLGWRYRANLYFPNARCLLPERGLQRVPIMIEGTHQEAFGPGEFWYRWHDLR